MASLRSDTKLMRDVPVEPQNNSIAQYVDSLPEERSFLDKLKGNTSLDVGKTQDHPLIQNFMDAIRTGQLDEPRVQKLMKRNPLSASVFASAFDEYKKASTQQTTAKDIYARNFGVNEQFGPTRPGEILQSVPRSNFAGAVSEFYGAGMPDQAKQIAETQKQMQEKTGGDKYEGSVLFDTNGNTYRATKEGKIVPIPVEGGAKIAPPVYPFQTTDPITGLPVQQVITKPEAARRAQTGTTTLGTTEAVGKQNIENQQKYKKNIAGLEKTESTLSALDKFVEAKGIQPGVGPVNATDRRTAETLHANVLAGLREIDDMGVLQPGELPFLERQIANPGSWKNVGQAKAIRAQIQTVRNRITKLKPILAKQYGLAPMETPKETKPKSGWSIQRIP